MGGCTGVWAGRRKRSLVGWFRSVNGCLPNLLTRQHKNQPEREFLKNGENPEILKIRNDKPKCTKPEFPKDPAKCWKKKRSEQTKSQTKPFKQKTGEEAHNKAAFQNVALNAKRDNRQAEQNRDNSWLCGMGGICVMQCVHACGRQQALPSAWRASKHWC